MTLEFDLTAAQSVSRNGAGGVLGFSELTSAARRPRDLARMLWSERRDEVVLHEDDVPKSAKQAAAGVLAGLARADNRRLIGADGEHRLSRGKMLGRAISQLGEAAPRELTESWQLRRRALADCSVDRQLPVRTATEPKRILYLRGNPTMHWKGHAVGGAATHMTGVINGMLDGSVAVEVLAPASLPGLRAEVRAVPLRRVFHFQPWLTLAAYAIEIERAAESLSTDVVYQRYEPGSLAGVRVAAAKKVPLILEYNGSELWVDRHWSSGGRPSRGFEAQERIEQHALEQASLIVVVSERLRDQLLARGIADARILVNPNGVDTDALAAFRDLTAAGWRTEIGLEEAPTVGFIGTFGLWHGVLELPEMVARVASGNPDARWLLIGDGQHWQDVQNELARRRVDHLVSMPGALPREQALRMLSAADLCVSPHVPNPDGSPFFGSPTKLFEYMGLGKPIVASDLEQIGEVLSHDKTGVLHEPGDSKAAAQAVIALLGDVGRRERLGRAALAQAEAKYTWRAHSQRIIEAIADRS